MKEWLTPEELAQDTAELRLFMEKGRFIPEGVHLGRTSVRIIEVAGAGLPQPVQDYLQREAEIFAGDQPIEKQSEALSLLQDIINDPEQLQAMCGFIVLRHRLISKL